MEGRCEEAHHRAPRVECSKVSSPSPTHRRSARLLRQQGGGRGPQIDMAYHALRNLPMSFNRKIDKNFSLDKNDSTQKKYNVNLVQFSEGLSSICSTFDQWIQTKRVHQNDFFLKRFLQLSGTLQFWYITCWIQKRSDIDTFKTGHK